MKVTRTVAVVVGLLTVWPLLFVVLCVAAVVGLFAGAALAGDAGSDPAAAFFVPVMMAGALATMLVSLALLVFYVVHVVMNPTLTTELRVVWAVLIFMAGFIAMPIYWYLYVWPQAVAQDAHT